MKTKLFSPWILWAVLLLGAVACWLWVSGDNVFPPNVYIAILLIPAVIQWLYLIIRATRVHPEAGLNPDKITQLVQTGVYGRLRHPMYVADIVLVWAVWLFWPEFRVLIFAAWLTVFVGLWIVVEERVLRQKFGQEHADYASRVPMVIPRIGPPPK